MKIIGHRGAMGLEPENTLRSFRRALDIGVDMIEFDVYELPSGELVIIHDGDVDRTTNGRGRLWRYTFEELRKLDAGDGEQIPTLQEVLDLIGRRVPVNIELKGPHTAAPVSQVMNDYIKHRGWQRQDFVVSSFNHSELRKFKSLQPKIEINVLFDIVQWHKIFRNAERAIAIAKRMNASAINPDLKFVSQTLVDEAHRAGLAVNVFTLKRDRDVLKMAQMNVDGIFTNFPDRAKEVLKQV